METLCRLCMNVGSVGMEPIFRSVMDVCLAKKIATVTQLKLFEGDGLPASLCQQCIFKLDIADTFIQKCTLSDRALRAMLTVQNKCSAPSGNGENRNSWQQVTTQSLLPMLSNTHRANGVIQFGPSKELQKDKYEDITKATIDFIKLEDSGEDEIIEPTSPYLKQTQVNLTAKDAINIVSDQMENFPEIVSSSLNAEMEKEVGNLTQPSQVSICQEKHLSEKNLEDHIKRHLPKKSRRHVKAGKAQKVLQVIPGNTNSPLPSSSATITEASGNPNLSCGICDRSFNSHLSLENHTLGHLSKRPMFSCDVCPKKFARIDILNEHKRRKCDRRGKGNLECDTCLKTFRLKKSLIEHILCHLVERPFNCAVCDKSFKRMHTLNSHMLLHSDKKPFKCTKCDMGFARLQTLTNHMVVHSNKRPHKCSTCNLGFKRFYNLKAHLLRCCKKQPRKCTVCDKMFTRTDLLEAHMLVHLTKQAHKCSKCGTIFARAAALKVHALTFCNKQAQKLRTKCTKCDKSFERMDKLRNHMLVHSNKYDHKCTKCDKTFKSENYLKKHLKYQHMPNTLDIQCKSSKGTDSLSASGYVCAVYGPTSSERPELESFTPHLANSHEPNDQESPTPSLANSPVFDNLDSFLPSLTASHEPNNLKSFTPSLTTSYETDGLKSLTSAVTASYEPHDQDSSTPSYKTFYESDSDSLVFAENLFPCEDSKESLSDCLDLESLLPSHEVTHKNSFTCKLCGQTFSEFAKLESHIPSHKIVLQDLFPCKVCGKKFNMLIDLESHMPNHEVDPECLFSCKVCGRRFSTEASVASHMIIHVRPQSHKCPKCTRCFLTTLGLKEHMKIHENY